MRLSLATRIFIGHAAVLLTFGGVTLFSVSELHQNQQEIRIVSQGYLVLAQDAAALESFHKNQIEEMARIAREPNPDTRRAFIRLAPRTFPPLVHERLEAARQTAALARTEAPGSERGFLDELDGRLVQLGSHFAEAETAASQSWETGDSAEGRSALQRAQEVVGRDLRSLRAALEARIRLRVENAEKRERRRGVLIIALSVLAIGVGLLATAWSARALRPIRTLIEGVGRIRRGDYSAQLGVRGADEISTLAREFNAMARALEEREAQLLEKQEDLLRAEQLAAVGRVSAQVAHEVRNPLSSIGLNVELLQESLAQGRFGPAAESREATALLAAVTREVDRLTEITDEYLRMARLPQPTLAPEDVNAVVSSVLDFSSEELGRARVEVVRELDPSAPRALADEGQLRQVFLNLVRNSREAMGRGGVLRVRSIATDGVVEIRFEDTGHGIPAEARGKLFEAFHSTKAGGTGLGLAVSRQILASHGGSITCAASDEHGTTFVVRLQRA